MVTLRSCPQGVNARGIPCSRERNNWHVLGNAPSRYFLKVTWPRLVISQRHICGHREVSHTALSRFNILCDGSSAAVPDFEHCTRAGCAIRRARSLASAPVAGSIRTGRSLTVRPQQQWQRQWSPPRRPHPQGLQHCHPQCARRRAGRQAARLRLPHDAHRAGTHSHLGHHTSAVPVANATSSPFHGTLTAFYWQDCHRSRTRLKILLATTNVSGRHHLYSKTHSSLV